MVHDKIRCNWKFYRKKKWWFGCGIVKKESFDFRIKDLLVLDEEADLKELKNWLK